MDHRVSYFKYVVLLLLLLTMLIPVSAFAGDLPEPKIGEAAPPFNLETLQGDKISLADLLGKFVVIHFATSW